MRRPRTTIAGLMLAVALAAGILASYQAGRRAQRAATPPPPTTVYITRRGTHYHLAGCRYAAAGTAVALDAVGPRYRPCAYCRPPAVPAP